MKVLFAVNNESISESIIKKYQQDYKEIISVKNVYYFNAIIKELQKDKSYDRIIVSEELQPFSNKNQDAIDKFIFEKMDNISDEATNLSGNDIPIILICTDRRTKSEPLLVKLFGIGVYNALIGKDRTITQVCELLARPRTKKEAKIYYHIDSEDVDYKVEDEGAVSEVEIQNILNHYKKLGGNEEKYIESFDHIAGQYTDSQLRLIAKFLPLNVKAVLEANCLKYQEVVSFNRPSDKAERKTANLIKTKEAAKSNVANVDLIQKNLSKGNMSEPIVIPSAINTDNIGKNRNSAENIAVNNVENISEPKTEPEIEPVQQMSNTEVLENNEVNNLTEDIATPKRRGRPKKVQVDSEVKQEGVKRGRGRPKKTVEPIQKEENNEEQMSITPTNESASINLFELGDEPAENTSSTSNMILPGLEEFEENNEFTQEDNIINSNNQSLNTNNEEMQNANYSIFENNSQELNTQYAPNQNMVNNAGTNNMFEMEENNVNVADMSNNNQFNQVETSSNYTPNLSGLVSKSQKIVAFVGTSKNGTSFLVNNIAELLSQKGINTAILDLTKNKNAYYIYTENEENLRETAYTCIENLSKGIANGIQVHKNLTVYTTLPGADEAINNYANILQTLTQNYSLVILDCDFETDYHYFSEAQELYLVQSLDVLTIQPLTAFLRNLKAKNVLYPEKIRIVLNKVVRLRSITEKTVIGGMAYYNDPSMSFMTELFNKDTVTYCSIPFEEQAYSKYLEGLVNCKISLNGFSKNFMSVLNKLGDMVYPLINNNKNKKGGYNQYNNYQKNNNFSGDMNSTLNKMKSSF